MLRKAWRRLRRGWDKIGAYRPFVNAEEDMELGRELTTGVDERIAFGPMAKGQKKYGSTAKCPKRDESPGIIYRVQRGDTMQGIAVKFGVTTEQIRRTNQLWTNDSLFLRDQLLIPVCLENGNGVGPSTSMASLASSEARSELNGTWSQSSARPHESGASGSIASPQDEESFNSPVGGGKGWTHPLSDSFESEDCFISPAKPDPPFWTPPAHYNSVGNVGEGSGRRSANGPLSPGSQSSPTSPSGRRLTVKDHSDNSFQDFLSRIDNVIATSRKQAKEDKHNKAWVTFESDSESEGPRGSGTSLRTQGRHLRYSLRKLEKAQDELFQL